MPGSSLGGGTSGDLVGMAAALYLRGVPLVSSRRPGSPRPTPRSAARSPSTCPAPRTRPAPSGRASLIVGDVGLPATLPVARRRDGMAECLKAGLDRRPGAVGAGRGTRPRRRWPRRGGALRDSSEPSELKLGIVDRDPFERASGASSTSATRSATRSRSRAATASPTARRSRSACAPWPHIAAAPRCGAGPRRAHRRRRRRRSASSCARAFDPAAVKPRWRATRSAQAVASAGSCPWPSAGRRRRRRHRRRARRSPCGSSDDRRSMRILLLNGPNLGRLGQRQPEIYGTHDARRGRRSGAGHAAQRWANARCAFQSNHEGALIDRLEQRDFDALVINPGASGAHELRAA